MTPYNMGCVPYQTIFSDEYNNHKFRYRAN